MSIAKYKIERGKFPAVKGDIKKQFARLVKSYLNSFIRRLIYSRPSNLTTDAANSAPHSGKRCRLFIVIFGISLLTLDGAPFVTPVNTYTR